MPKPSKIASKIDPKTKRKLTWKLIENHESMIRMQGSKTSKIMLPCGRRAHLHKSASFKTIFEIITCSKNVNYLLRKYDFSVRKDYSLQESKNIWFESLIFQSNISRIHKNMSFGSTQGPVPTMEGTSPGPPGRFAREARGGHGPYICINIYIYIYIYIYTELFYNISQYRFTIVIVVELCAMALFLL